MLDRIFRGGTIIDGSGKPAWIGDVGIQGGRIVLTAPHIALEAAETEDITGCAIAPGFIDMHSHSDTCFLLDDRCQSKLFQGITTEVCGQCGSTIYPSPAGGADDDGDYSSIENAFRAPSFGAHLDKVRAAGKRMSTNLVPLIGHGALRETVIGTADRPATSREIERMCALLEADLQTGAWGMSLGLGYAPGISAEQEELNRLGTVVARYGGIVTSHMRHQDERTPEALEEMYRISRYSGAHVHISHFKVSDRKNWGNAASFIRWIRDGQRSGIPVTVDLYPYRASSSGITNCWPNWAIQGGRKAAYQRLFNSDRARIIEALSERFVRPEDGDGLTIVYTYGKFPEADGKTIRQIALEQNVTMPEAALLVAERTGINASVVSFSMCDEDVETMLRENDFVLGTDGRGYSLNPAEVNGRPHPRNFGTMPRFLRMARTGSLCPIETAVRRMTGLTAEMMGLADRGLLSAGKIADIVIFDPETVSDAGDYTDPIHANIGIRHVLLGGQYAIRDGVQTDLRGGRFLLKR